MKNENIFTFDLPLDDEQRSHCNARCCMGKREKELQNAKSSLTVKIAYATTHEVKVEMWIGVYWSCP